MTCLAQLLDLHAQAQSKVEAWMDLAERARGTKSERFCLDEAAVFQELVLMYTEQLTRERERLAGK